MSVVNDGTICSFWRDGREAEGNGLLNRHTGDFPYRGFESLSLRQLAQIN